MRLKYLLFFLMMILAACTPGTLEPGSDGIPVTRELSATATPTARSTEDIALSETEIAILTTTPTPWDVPSLTPPLTIPAAEGPLPTMTPVPPFPGFRYETEAGIWQVNSGWQPELLVDQTDLTLSEDGLQGLYIEEGHIWLLDIASGERHNLTGGSGRTHCCVQWWPARPGTVVFGSWLNEDYGPSSGNLSAVQTDGSGYTVLADGQSNAEPALAPDGQQIAYDLGGTAWIYNMETEESTQLDPAAYGIENVQRIAGPSWSPDGRKIAWTIAATNPDWRISVVVFDLETNTVQQFHEYENIGRGGWFPGPSWHPDGEWLAFVAEASDPEQFGVWAIHILTGEEQLIGHGVDPLWSPDGQWLAYKQYISPQSGDVVPKLVEFDSWHQINLYIPDNGHLLDWVNPNE